ncbi:MAG: hypothetical protein COA47_06650 [Robiginitomaculum sp.]|nr:MAG: hypothetical protein COA47_06650 [Robiginitomaculum sp.]
MELIDTGRYAAGLLFTVGLMLAVWMAVRRFAPGMITTKPSSERQLHIIESLHLDARRKLVLIEDGEREHLVLLGTSGESLIESRKKSQKRAPAKPLNRKVNS